MAQRFRPFIEIEGRAPLTHCLRLSISQAIFDHHHFELVVPYETLEGPKGNGFFQQAHKELCGRIITISFAPIITNEAAPDFKFKGLITQLRLGSTDDLASVYIIEGYSPTYLLEDSTQRRTFIKQTLSQICSQVLTDYGRNTLGRKVDPHYKAKIPYAVQYDENNFTFLKRMAAARGEWLYYTGTQLLIGPAAENAAVPFVVGGAQSFSLTVSLRPTKFKATEYNYRQHQTLRATSREQPASQQGTLTNFAAQTSERLFPQAFHVGAGQRVSSSSELNEAMQLLKTNLTGSLVVFEGVGENPNVAVGGLIQAQQPATNGRKAADLGKYRVLAIDHWLDDEGNYCNKFRAVPAGSGPPPVPWTAPVAGALELAKVIDVADPKRLGRIRVQYQWPTATETAAQSGWLRVSTPYSGDGKGQLFTPEVGSQVLVGYEQQQAELPVVLGNLFHPQNPQNAQYTRPNNHLKGLQTAGGNKLVFDDTKTKQTILISNSHEKGTARKLSFKGDGSIAIKSNGPVTVDSPTISLEAGKHGSIRLHGKNITIDAEKKLELLSSSITKVAGLYVDIDGAGHTNIQGGTVDIN